MRRRPNILWICTDEQRWDTIGALGNPHILTSQVDRLVAEGVAFTHTFCQSPICTASRSSFLTGMHPSSVHGCCNGSVARHCLVARDTESEQTPPILPG